MKEILSIKYGYLKIETDKNVLRKIEFIKSAKEKDKIDIKDSSMALQQLKQYFDKNRQKFKINLSIFLGIQFQRKVWEELVKIPYGETRSYKDIADKLGNVKLARAVGMACGANPFLIVVPCHRVVATKGGLGGYSAGLNLKKYLLELESD
jgi:methylated-DNA-[protein]-cysteine S-methyltransferase